MKIYIMADNEGMSGVYTFGQVTRGHERRSEGRAAMTADVNACAEGLKRAGVDTIVVHDAHSGNETLYWDQLSPAIDECVIGKTGQHRFFGAEGADGVILLGYHPMAGTMEGMLHHTWSTTYQNVYLNGRRAGELAIDAAIAGDMGIPIIMVSGDDKLRAEAADFVPWAVYAQVKRGIAIEGGALLSPARAHALIAAKAQEAVESISRMQLFRLEHPVTMRVELTQPLQAPREHSKPYMTIIDSRTYDVVGENMLEALNRHN